MSDDELFELKTKEYQERFEEMLTALKRLPPGAILPIETTSAKEFHLAIEALRR